MSLRRASVLAATFIAASAAMAAAQPIVYAVVNPQPITDSAGLYKLTPRARLYSIDVSSGTSTSVTLPGTSCYFGAQPDGSRLYAACGASVSAIDSTGLTVLATASLPYGAQCCASRRTAHASWTAPDRRSRCSRRRLWRA